MIISSFTRIFVFSSLFCFVSLADGFLDVSGPGVHVLYNISDNPAGGDYNRGQLSAALSVLGPTGGTITFPAGTFYFRQANPSEQGPPAIEWGQFNAAIIVTAPVTFSGQGAGQTILIADNRATTVFLFQGGSASSSSIRMMTIRGNIYRRFDGYQITDRSPLDISYGAHSLGDWNSLASLVIVDGTANGPLTYFAATSVAFENPANVGIFLENTAMVQIQSCSFSFFMRFTPPYQYETGGHNVGIFGKGQTSGANVWGCTFSGSSYLDSSIAGYNPQDLTIWPYSYAADGLVWFTGGGNFDISGNTIINYRLEGTQVNSGPAYIHNNIFQTSDRGISNALSVSSGAPAYSFYSDYYFENNSVNGGGSAVITSGGQTNSFLMTIANNSITLAPQKLPGNWVAPAISMQYCQTLTVQNNGFHNVSRGVALGDGCGTAVINGGNDMREIHLAGVTVQETHASLTQIDISNNSISKGDPQVAGQWGHFVDISTPSAANYILTGSGNTFYDTNGTTLLTRPFFHDLADLASNFSSAPIYRDRASQWLNVDGHTFHP